MTCSEIVQNIRHVFIHELHKTAHYQELFDSIIIGCQDAHHEIYAQLQKAYPVHLLPTDFENGTSHVKSVVSYAIVFKNQTTAPKESFSPKPWVEATYFFRALSNTINASIHDTFSDTETIIVPRDTPLYTRIDTGDEFLSSWSERHIAYTCGIGTFGLHHALITEKGCQVRLSSLVTSASLDMPPKTLPGMYDHCLYYMYGTCQQCIKKCPVLAIAAEKKNMVQCYIKEDTINKAYNSEQYGIHIPTCGLCMMGVPCSMGIPVNTS
jgi:epoxyqueuosine reductase